MHITTPTLVVVEYAYSYLKLVIVHTTNGLTRKEKKTLLSARGAVGTRFVRATQNIFLFPQSFQSFT